MEVSSSPSLSSSSSCPSFTVVGNDDGVAISPGPVPLTELAPYSKAAECDEKGSTGDCKGTEVFEEGNSVEAIGRVRWSGRAVMREKMKIGRNIYQMGRIERCKRGVYELGEE